VNAISRPILRNTANAIAGMALRGPAPRQADKPTIAITQLGQTTVCVMRVKSILEPMGYQLVPFHASGAGGPAMEDLAEADKFVGVIDLSVHEIMDGLMGGIAGAQNRLDVLTRHKIRRSSRPAATIMCCSSPSKRPEKFRTAARWFTMPR
jgi:uncharacterized protein (UPF0261 family)